MGAPVGEAGSVVPGSACRQYGSANSLVARFWRLTASSFCGVVLSLAPQGNALLQGTQDSSPYTTPLEKATASASHADLASSSEDTARIAPVEVRPPFTDARKLNIARRPFRGNKDAKVTIVLFDDFQCPYCAAMYRTLFDDVLKDYADRVKIFALDTPMQRVHPWALHAAIDANCLAAQRTRESNDAYWEFSGYVHQHQNEIASPPGAAGGFAALDKLALRSGEAHGLDSKLLNDCIQAQFSTAVEESFQKSVEAGVTAVPVLLINNQRLVGAVPAEDVRSLIDYVLQRVGQPVIPTSQTAPAMANPDVDTGNAAGSKRFSTATSFNLGNTSRMDVSNTKHVQARPGQ